MQILCELKSFKETVTRGRFSGNETEYSIAIGGDNYSWDIVKVTHGKSTPPIGQKYFKGFCHLLDQLSSFDIDPYDAISKIVPALQKNTGTNPTNELTELISNKAKLQTIGEKIDEVYRCNYNRAKHDSGQQIDKDRIYIRVLKAKIGQKD